MKKISLIFSFLLLLFYSCNNADEPKTATSENDVDAARNFIRAALDGEYENGRNMLLSDSINYQYYNEYEKAHSKMSEAEKMKYKNASINVHAVTPINDSTTIIIFSNSYKNDHDTLKLLKISGQWRVDLKYLFDHDMDSVQQLINKKDTLPK